MKSPSQFAPLIYFFYPLAGMAELADALDLGSSAERRAGSSPVPGTNDARNIFVRSSKSPSHHNHCNSKYH